MSTSNKIIHKFANVKNEKILKSNRKNNNPKKKQLHKNLKF